MLSSTTVNLGNTLSFDPTTETVSAECLLVSLLPRVFVVLSPALKCIYQTMFPEEPSRTSSSVLRRLNPLGNTVLSFGWGYKGNWGSVRALLSTFILTKRPGGKAGGIARCNPSYVNGLQATQAWAQFVRPSHLPSYLRS